MTTCTCGCCDDCDRRDGLDALREDAYASPHRLVDELQAFAEMVERGWLALDRGDIADVVRKSLVPRARAVAAAHPLGDTGGDGVTDMAETQRGGDPIHCDVPRGPERDAIVVAACEMPGYAPSHSSEHAMAALDRWIELHPDWHAELFLFPGRVHPHWCYLRRPTAGWDCASAETRADAVSAAIVLAYRAVLRGDA